ncbi:MAG TPA: putative inorganic carbon transporter subunit DabA, partial [Labilithrix sp.]|nr:putative inorganic carbon transporter subunit DabA [Labilithrix sp.]
MKAPDLKEAAERACARIAPTWPLDRFIAVNPFWPCTDRPLPRVAGELAALSGARLLMPRSWYAEEWRGGRLRPEHLLEAIAESGADVTEEHLTALFWIDEPRQPRRPLVVDVMDARSRGELELPWQEFILERMSRFCGSYFDDGQAQIGAVKTGGLYASWRDQARVDRGPALLMGLHEYRSTVASLPKTADEMMAVASPLLGVPADERENYLSALLLDINGWASWCAYLRWTARLAGQDDDHILELLSIRVAWEWILLRSGGEELRADWRHALASWPAFDRAAQSARKDDWLLQRAVE